MSDNKSADTKEGLSARQYAVKAIHEDQLNVKNPSILAKLLKDYANEQKWISVEDSPKESGRYWCYVSEHTALGLSHYQWNCAYNKEENRWSDDHIIKNVTYWQPLPPPPEGL